MADFRQKKKSSIKMDEGDILITQRLTQSFLRNQGLKKTVGGRSIWGVVFSVSFLSFFVQDLFIDCYVPWPWLLGGLLGASLLAWRYMAALVQLGERFPASGGLEIYTEKNLGSFWGYFIGMVTVMMYLVMISLILQNLQELLNYIFIPEYVNGIVVGAFFIMLLLNFFTNDFLSLLHYYLGFFIIGLFILFGVGVWDHQGIYTHVFFSSSSVYSQVENLLFSLLLFLGSYWGFLAAGNLGEEIKDPERDLKVGFKSAYLTLLGFLVLTILLLNWKFALTGLVWSKFISFDILRLLHPEDMVLGKVYFAGVIVVLIGVMGVLIRSYSRQIYAMARAGYFPGVLHKLHSDKIPSFAVLLPAVIVFCLFFLKAEILHTYFWLALLFIYLMVILVSSKANVVGKFDFWHPKGIKEVGDFLMVLGISVLIIIAGICFWPSTYQSAYFYLFFVGYYFFFPRYGTEEREVSYSREDIKSKVDFR